MIYIFLYIVLSLVIYELVFSLINSRRSYTEGIFKSNGCNFVPEGNWEDCCEQHDKAYRSGGWYIARWKADIELMKCIFRNKNPFAAILYFLGVRLFGAYAFRYGKKRELRFE